MPLLSKLRLSILLLFLQLFVYLYVVPREPAIEVGFPSACRTTAARPRGDCLAGGGYFRRLAGNCGRRLEPLPTPERQEAAAEPEPEEEVPQPPEDPPPAEVLQDPGPQEDPPVAKQNLTQEPRPVGKRAPERVPEKSGDLVYQIIVVLLFLSFSIAIADCVQERAKKKSPEMERQESLNRRMSLADLTMSRHARKESQASYRPLGKPRKPLKMTGCLQAIRKATATKQQARSKSLSHFPFVCSRLLSTWEKRPLLATRSCSQEVPMKSKAVTRQTSCPQFDDDPSLERRRVRMIQRH